MSFLMVQFKHSNSHTVFPKIIIGFLLILLAVMIVQRILESRRTGTPFINTKDFKFFQEGYNKLKFWATIVLLIFFVVTVRPLGFIVSGVITVSLLNILYSEDRSLKSIIISIVISIVEVLIVWYLFGYILRITLPRGILG